MTTPPSSPPDDAVWSYRGYKLKPGEFVAAMVHFFRAEVSRSNVWRQRLDVTTNWAVVTTGAGITYAFSQVNGHHGVLPLNALLITLFLFTEARRYRYYELWSYRVRLMETDFLAAMLVPPFHPDPDWAESLAQSLLHPDFPISLWEALGRRLRNNYLAIYTILGLAWVGKLWLHPVTATSWSEFASRAAIGSISGQVILALSAVFGIIIIVLGLLTMGLHQASGEVLPRFTADEVTPVIEPAEARATRRAWFRHTRRRRQLMALVITDKPEEVAQPILKEMRRGVTSLPGKGMFTHKPHNILLCALTITEIPHLKAVVKQTDPNAFVIVSPAHEVLGRGFLPLEP